MGLVFVLIAAGLGLYFYSSSSGSSSKLDVVYKAALDKETNSTILDEFAKHLRDSGYNDKATFIEQKSISLKQSTKYSISPVLPMSVIQVPQVPQVQMAAPITTVIAPAPITTTTRAVMSSSSFRQI
jgi:hypothetical protein